ncbi:hypothetical protein SAMN05920897_106137 [Alkalispirochaeta americana]|uniref:Ketoreductase domain-containing protein n=1 Tax=Alkalispirochaeta americana TaxID=159291 RepID=A0A1N6RJP3_9SPIO|nr:SDR family oxidoreductase [Alkalispirochaeta americana]SIQ29007.1 hypothetical protein SAMN05920897_106137 [Alkalispirochaeta americana]
MDQKGHVLITGASRGIGFALAREFARRGYPLVVTARDPEPLAAAARSLKESFGLPVLDLAEDLSDKGAPLRIATALDDRGISPHILINNAGFGLYGPFLSIPPEDGEKLLQVNISALVALTRLFLPAMVARRKGGVMNVASTAGFLPGPLMASYYASKAFVVSFSHALARETAGAGLTVTALCPGPTVSEFQKRSGMHQSWILRKATLPAEVVARTGVDGFFRRKILVVPGVFNKASVFSSRLVPRSVAARMVEKLQG